MFTRTLWGVLLLTTFPVISAGQTTPQLSRTPTDTDTQLVGTAQAPTAEYDSVLLYVCASMKVEAPLDCTHDDPTKGRQKTLVNLGNTPYTVNAKDEGKFTITMPAALVQGSYVWILQVTRTHGDQKKDEKPVETMMISTPVRVPVPLLLSASIALAGFDSAAKDAGGKVTFSLTHGLQDEGSGATFFNASTTYDDKWKSTPLSSNVTHNYWGFLSQSWAINSLTAWGLFANAYHNNSLGIRVDQDYGVGITREVKMPNKDYLTLMVVGQAMLFNLYSPGKDAKLGGVKVSAELHHKFINKTSIDLTVGGTPVFPESNAWNANGEFNLKFPISKRWSFSFDVVDNYYEIAPKTFNKNYLENTIGLKFK